LTRILDLHSLHFTNAGRAGCGSILTAKLHHPLRLLTALVLVVVCRTVSAQDDLTLRGTVRDESGGPVAGAQVTLTPRQSQPLPPPHWTTTSDANGSYTLEHLSPGRYLLSISVPGFALSERSVDMTARGAANGDAIVRVAITEKVEVIGSLDDLRRLTGMRPTGLLLGPEQLGLLPNDPDMMLQVLQELSATTGRPDQVAVFVDGQPVTTRLPPRESILSIRISTNAFASEFAEPSSGVVEVITKPATNRYSGESQYTLNDSALNARNAFETVKQPTSTHAFSGYLAGPIIRHRWSFLGYAGRWQRNDRLHVNSTYVDPVRLVAEPFAASVPTPSRTDAFSLRSDVALSSAHLLSAELVGDRDVARNQGLQTGLDLPERGVDHDGRADGLRVALVSAFSPRNIFELRARGERRRVADHAISSTPAVLVLDTFYAGGNQASLHQERATESLSSTAAFTRALARHSIRAGARFDSASVDEFRRTNPSGTFVFGSVVDGNGDVVATPLDRYLRTVNGVAGYGPSWFSIARGESQIHFRDWQASWFVQDDWHPSGKVTLSYGLRHDLQEQSRSRSTFAPRGGVAWRPGGRHTLRIAGGLFYSHIPADIALDVLRYDGIQVREYVIDHPAFFPTISATVEDIGTSLPTVRVSDHLDTPRTLTGSASYEWQISRLVFGSIVYTTRRGAHLLRTVNINEPDPVTGMRPRPDAGPVLQFSSAGRSASDDVSVTIRGAFPRVSLFATYTLGRSQSDTDGPYSVAANSTSRYGEFARAGDDQRHRAVAGSVVNLPGDVSVSALLTANSGRPFNITTGRDDNGDLLFVDRPGAAEAGDAGTLVTPFGTFDVSLAGGQSMIDRNTGRGPSYFALNVGVGKKFVLGHSTSSVGGTTPYVIVTASAANVTNRVNYADFNGVVTSPLFGTANRALPPRRIELAARVGF
jgi:hypothetical protein